MSHSNRLSFIILVGILFFCTSCKEVVTEFDCGLVDTEIEELGQRVGAYMDSTFTSSSSSDFETAAMQITVEKFAITTDTETSCFSYTAVPQKIASINIVSSTPVESGGILYSPMESLTGLFKIISDKVEYSVVEFISAHTDNPLIFHDDDDELILQLINAPDSEINQSFNVEITFDDATSLSVEVENFVVSN